MWRRLLNGRYNIAISFLPLPLCCGDGYYRRGENNVRSNDFGVNRLLQYNKHYSLKFSGFVQYGSCVNIFYIHNFSNSFYWVIKCIRKYVFYIAEVYAKQLTVMIEGRSQLMVVNKLTHGCCWEQTSVLCITGK